MAGMVGLTGWLERATVTQWSNDGAVNQSFLGLNLISVVNALGALRQTSFSALAARPVLSGPCSVGNGA